MSVTRVKTKRKYLDVYFKNVCWKETAQDSKLVFNCWSICLNITIAICTLLSHLTSKYPVSSLKPRIINCDAEMLNLLMVRGIQSNCGGDLIDFVVVCGRSTGVVGQNVNLKNNNELFFIFKAFLFSKKWQIYSFYFSRKQPTTSVNISHTAVNEWMRVCMSSDGHPFGFVSLQSDHFPRVFRYFTDVQVKLNGCPALVCGAIVHNDSFLKALQAVSSTNTEVTPSSSFAAAACIKRCNRL